jgi:hydroxypyruvate reductase
MGESRSAVMVRLTRYTSGVSDQLKQVATEIFLRALEDCSIERAFARVVCAEQRAGERWLVVDGADVARLDGLKRVRVLALGKAAVPMLEALLAKVRFEGCDVRGVLIAPQRPERVPGGFAYFAGGHPSPNVESLAAARAALAMMREAASEPEGTLCVFLVSGGGSSLMELPLDGAISLEDTVAFHRALVASGASIVEMNCVRKHFSAVKGGRMALAAGAARKVSLFVSDVPPGRLDALASGPTIPDVTTSGECREIIRKYGMEERFPAAVHAFFAGNIPETPKPGELESAAHVLLSSEELAEAARAHAEAMGFTTVVDNTCDDWPYERSADYLLGRVRELRREHTRVCVISCGEVTVTLPAHLPNEARGGRNQQWASYVATRLRAQDAPIAALSGGSDGIDGNSVAAGAVVDERTADVRAEEVLRAFSAYEYLRERGAVLMTGPTGQNLRDLRILVGGE